MYTTCRCGSWLTLVLGQGSNFATSHKQYRTDIRKIFKVIWHQYLRFVKLNTMVKEFSESNNT